MFTKFKQAVENWLRGLIAAEVSKLNRDLSNERASLCATIRTCSAQINAAVDRLLETSYFTENVELRNTIKQLIAHSAGLVDIVKRLHPEMSRGPLS